MNIDGPKLWGIVDPDYVAPPGKESCLFRSCKLYSGHEGPHLDAHHSSGRIFGLWPNTGEDIVSPTEVSGTAVKIAMKLNELRDEAVEAIEAVMAYEYDMKAKYAGTSDEHVQKLLNSPIWPTSEHEITYSGTEMSQEGDIREELLDILGLNGEEDH